MVERAKESGGAAGVPKGAVLAGGAAVGIAGDLLLYSSAGPGLNLFLMFGVLALAVGAVSHRAGLRPSLEAVTWMALGLLFASAFAWRASGPLQFLSFVAASAAFAFPALRAGAAWLRGSGVSDSIEAVGGAMLHSGLGALRLLVGRRPNGRDSAESGSSGRRVGGLLRGLVLAVPFLFVFGALFVSADRVFAEMVTGLFRVEGLDELAAHLFLIGGLTWLAAGYLSGWVTGTRLRDRLGSVASFRPSLGILETGTVLALVDVLFAAFVLVQIRYLFGGSALVEVTPGLTYSEYAREGFAQLVVAAGLVLPVLLTSDWLLRQDEARDALVFRLLGGLQLLLLLVVIASAFHRLWAYQDAYGLTESRFYGAVLLAWLVLLAVWFAATILRGRRHRFMAVAVVSGFAVLGTLLLLNPDAQIARTNLDRAADGAFGDDFDARYLASLSADAVPDLLDALPDLPLEARCAVAEVMHRRWGTDDREADWRSWNRSEARARRLVGEASPELSISGCPADGAPRAP